MARTKIGKLVVAKAKHVRDAVYESREFFGLQDPGGVTFENLRLRGCTFVACNLSGTANPKMRSVVRNVLLESCTVHGGWIGPAVVEDSVIDTLAVIAGPAEVSGTVFRHVALRGRIGSLLFFDGRDVSVVDRESTAMWKANGAYYEGVDWALDITRAEFEAVRLQGIPARLIRRDSEDQVVVRREKVADGAWRQVDLRGTYWPTSLENLLAFGDQDMVLAAPRAHKDYKKLKAGLERLRNAGVAEPD